MAINFDKNKCCGCMACKNICPKDAITIEKDEKGFIYPKVDKSKCIECGLCEKICDFNKDKRNENLTKKAYSLIHKDNKVLFNSTSGGAFTVLSDIILDRNGVVFGAVMDDDFTVHHIAAYDKKTRDKMRGSKYIQSDAGLIYRKVKEELNNNKDVLFVGTPCQVGGLISFLRKPYKNLITVEFLCHGVPSNDFFKNHISFLEKRYNRKASNYSFRSKRYAWYSPAIESITFDNRIIKDSLLVNAYTHFFYYNVSLRPSCYKCTYRKYERVADITIADFWGMKKAIGKRDLKGVSLVLANSDKGLQFIGGINDEKVKIGEVETKDIKTNFNIKPLISKYDRNEFWKRYVEHGYEYLVDKYIDNSKKNNIEFVFKKECRKLAARMLCKKGK